MTPIALLRGTAAALMLATLPMAQALAGDDADDAARDIFRQVEKACPVGANGTPYNLATIAATYFVDDLRVQLDHAYANHVLEFDILIDAQDCEIPDVDLDEVGDDDDHRGQMIVRAKFDNFGEPRVVDLVMVRQAKEWKVADVVYRHRDWSLRRDIDQLNGK